jgi:hypothetical protein
MVPKPGFSRNGIQSNKTLTLMMNVVQPILSPVRRESPCAMTVHGPLPKSETTTSASPVPNSQSPRIKITMVPGFPVHLRSERQRVIGTVLAGLSHEGTGRDRNERSLVTHGSDS